MAELVLTAGFDRALHVVAVGELLRRDGHRPGVLVVSPYNLKRVRSFVTRRGVSSLLAAARRIGDLDARRERQLPLGMFLEENGISQRSLRSWAGEHGLPLRTVPGLGDQAAVDFVREHGADGVLYGGGGILRKPFLEAAGRRVLNAHSGPLPDIRGMNAVEWSLLLGRPPTVTIHYIDEGIDTGRSILALPIPIEPGDTLAVIRSRAAMLGVRGMIEALPAFLDDAGPAPGKRSTPGRQCFVLAPVLRELLEQRLADGTGRPERPS